MVERYRSIDEVGTTFSLERFYPTLSREEEKVVEFTKGRMFYFLIRKTVPSMTKLK